MLEISVSFTLNSAVKFFRNFMKSKDKMVIDEIDYDNNDDGGGDGDDDDNNDKVDVDDND